MPDATTPFARWCARMGERLGKTKPISRRYAAALLDTHEDTVGRYYSGAKKPPRAIALACAAIEAGIEPIK